MMRHFRHSRLPAHARGGARLARPLLLAVASLAGACRPASDEREDPSEQLAPAYVEIAFGGGGGGGRVISDPPGIACRFSSWEFSESCGAYFAREVTISLKARADSGSAFLYWTEGGSTLTTDSTFSFRVRGSRTLTVSFVATLPTLYTVRGVVRDTGLRALVGGATVTIGSRTIRSDSLGNYAIDSLSAGSYAVTVISTRHVPFQDRLTLCCGRTSVRFDVSLSRLAPWVMYLTMDTTPRLGWLWGQTRVAWASGAGAFPSRGICIECDWGGGTNRYCNDDRYDVLNPNARAYLFPGCPGVKSINTYMCNLAGYAASFTCTPGGLCKEDGA